jgi:hypothetical protein
MAINYHLPEPAVNSTASPLGGRYLAHNQLSLVKKAFFGADLATGRRPLVAPTVLQSAMLARVNPTYVRYAIKRLGERTAIEAGLIPLVPPHSEIPVPPANGNGHAPPLSNGNGTTGHTVPTTLGVEDSSLFDLIAAIGVDRVINCAVEVERALHA